MTFRSTPNADLHTAASNRRLRHGRARGLARFRRRANHADVENAGHAGDRYDGSSRQLREHQLGTSEVLATRASANVEYLRRALLKFDTQNTMPADSQVRSAVLTLTVKQGGADANRTIAVFPVTTSFVQEPATWNVRRVATPWASPAATSATSR